MPDVVLSNVNMPSQAFLRKDRFEPVANGQIFVGQKDTDPRVPANQIQVYFEQEDGTLTPVSQPIRIGVSGYPVYNGQYGKFLTNSECSVSVLDVNDVQQWYWPNLIDFDSSRMWDVITSNAGAGVIGYIRGNNYGNNTVGKALNSIFAMLPTVNIADYPSLKAAIAAIPNGGTVYVPVGRWESGSWDTTANNMTTDNVRIIGERAPVWNSTLTRLIGGSVICDRFIAFANNLTVENIGFDAGRDYINSKYPGANTATSSHPDGGTWDAFVFGAPTAGAAQRNGLMLRNVIGLMYNSTAIGHAVLTECYSHGTLENVVGIYGYHGVIVKASDVVATGIYTYGQSKNGLIIKADQFSGCGNVVVHDHTYAYQPRNTAPWSQPAYAEHAIDIDPNAVSFNGPIYIGKTSSAGAIQHVHFGGLVKLTDVHIVDVVTDGLAANAAIVGEYSLIADGSTTFSRVHVGQVRVTNCKHGVYGASPTVNPDDQISIERLDAVNITNAIIYALDNAVITVDSLSAQNFESLYFMTNAGKIYVGSEKHRNMTGEKFMSTGGGVAPAMTSGWEQSAGDEVYDFSLKNYKACVKGFLHAKPGATNEIINLPAPLRPATAPRIPAVMIAGGTPSVNWVSVVNSVRTADGTLPANISHISLSNVEWDY